MWKFVTHKKISLKKRKKDFFFLWIFMQTTITSLWHEITTMKKTTKRKMRGKKSLNEFTSDSDFNNVLSFMKLFMCIIQQTARWINCLIAIICSVVFLYLSHSFSDIIAVEFLSTTASTSVAYRHQKHTL